MEKKKKNEDLTQTPQVVLVVKNLPAMIPGGGHGNPLQHSCLENPMDRGASGGGGGGGGGHSP